MEDLRCQIDDLNLEIERIKTLAKQAQVQQSQLLEATVQICSRGQKGTSNPHL